MMMRKKRRRKKLIMILKRLTLWVKLKIQMIMSRI